MTLPNDPTRKVPPAAPPPEPAEAEATTIETAPQALADAGDAPQGDVFEERTTATQARGADEAAYDGPTHVDRSNVKSLASYVVPLVRGRERLLAAANRLDLGAVDGEEARALARVLREVAAKLDEALSIDPRG